MHQPVKTSYAFALVIALSIGTISLVNWVNDKIAVLDEENITTQVAQVTSTLGNGLAAYYKFDDASATSATDSSGNGRDGSFVSSPSLTSDARVGTGAITFSGANKVSGPSVSLSGTDFSFAFWVKTTTPSNSMVGMGYNSFCAFNSKSISCTVDGNISGGALVTEPAIYSGSWHHVVYVVNGSTQKLYIDGTERATASETPASLGGGLSVGVRFGSTSGFVGSLDDVRFYTRAITPSEISDLASGSGAGASTSNTNTTATQTTSQPVTTMVTNTSSQLKAPLNAVATNGSLLVSKSGTGGGSVTSPSGINCGSQCNLTLASGSVVKLTAGAESGSTFTGWSGGGCSGNLNTCTVTLTDTVNVNATFTANTVSSDLSAPGELQVTESYFAYASSGQYNTIEFYLRWKDNNSNEDGYVVEESVNGAPFTIVKTLPANSLSFIDRGNNTSIYKYRVKAFKGSSYSLPSNTLEFTGIPQPTYYVAETSTINSTTLYFNDRTVGTNTTIGYQIERSDDGGNTYKIIAKKISGDYEYVPNLHSPTGYKKFIDDNNGTGLTPGKTYYYRVAGYNNTGFSPYANRDVPAEITTPYIIVAPGAVPALPGISVSLTQLPSSKIRITDNSNNETQFEVQKSTDNTNWSSFCVMNWSAGDKSCEDKSVVAGGKYYYRARAYNNSSTPASAANIYATSGFVYSNPVVLAGAAPTGVTEWYIWKGATAGTNTGESWANAWQDIDQINWKAIKPGDTIYISGDNYGKPLSIYGSGVQGKPIKIYTGIQSPNPSGHSGKVTLSGIGFNQNASWIDIDGSLNKNYNLTSALNVDDNINLFVDNGTGIYSNGSNGVNLRFIKVSNASDFGIYFNGVSDMVELYGVHVYYTVQAGIRFGYPSPRPVYDAIKITKALIEHAGDDGIQVGGTMTVADTIIRKGNLNVTTGHPDGIQGLNANYLDVHNTTIYDREKSSYMIVDEFMMSSTFTRTDYGHVRIYNNEFYYTNPDMSPVTSGIYISASIITPAPIDYENWDDILIANNTFYNVPKTTPIAFGMRDQISKVTAKNIVVKNNLLYNVAKDFGVAFAVSPRITLDSSTRIDNNLVAGYVTKMSFGGTIYDNAELFNTGTGFKGNTSATPKFVNLSGFNLRLSSDDTAARGKGENLSQYFNFDKDNTSRPSTGAWDIGAYQGGGTPVIPNPTPIPTPTPTPLPNPSDVTSGLLLNINFDGDDFTTINNDTNKTITFKDSSGKNYNGTCQTALSLNNILNNQCPQKAVGVKSGNSAKLSGSLCDMSSDYIGIPTGGELSYLTRGTVSVYAAFDSMSYLGQHIIDTYTADIKNTWALHLDGDRFPTLTIVDDAGSAVDIITFPTAVKVGDWNNYAFTWDGSYIKAYFNGMFAGQAKMTGISGLKFFELPSKDHVFGVNYMTLGAMKHNEPRNYPDTNCWNQYGYVKQNYVYPNAGWMTGRIDEVRIYNRDLAQSEISSLASLVSNAGQSVLSVTIQGDGDGDVVTTVAGIGCGKHCAEAYNNGTSLTLKAIPRFNSRFVAWTSGCSGTATTCSITLNSNTQVVANFTKIDPSTVTLNANSATSITDPFINIGGSVFQYKASSTPGRLQFDFTLPFDGDYSISGLVNAPSQGSNSFYINVDDEPDPKVETNGWYIPTTGGYDNRFVNWGGDFNNGVRDANGVSVPKFFTLSAGNHRLIVKGREEGTAFRSFDLIRRGGSTSSAPVTQTPTNTGSSGSTSGSSSGSISGSTSGSSTGNTTSNTPIVISSDADGDGINNSIDKCPYTKPGVRVNNVGCPLIVTSKYNTLDLSNLDFNSIPTLEFSNSLGKVSYPQGSYNLARNSGDAIDIDSNLNISKGIVSLNSTQVPELNKPATITLYNITQKSPKIIRDGVECTTCKIISFTNGTLVFTVSGFSTYTIVEGDTGSSGSVSSGGGGGSSSSGGGSGGGSSAPIVQNASSPTVTNTSASSASSISGGVGYASIRPLSITMTDPMVRTLQQKLNARGYTVTSSGPGSKGNETTYFGKATQTSLKQYQCAVMKVCSGANYGVLDQLTYISLFGVTATTTVAPNTQTPVPSSSGKYIFTKTLSLGSNNEEVRQLQIFLNNKGYTVTSSGPGSKGNETIYFGNATKKALIKYQTDNKIYPSSGLFGPITRGFVNK